MTRSNIMTTEGEVNNNDYLFIVISVSKWDIGHNMFVFYVIVFAFFLFKLCWKQE